MNTYKLDYKRIADQIRTIHDIAQKDSWVPYYDEELDNFYFSPKIVNKDYSLHALGDEFLVYLDKDSNLGGVFIEYFRNNLTSHDIKFKPFKDLITNKVKFDKEKKILLLNTLEAALLEVMRPKGKREE